MINEFNFREFELADRAEGYIEETLESAGCAGSCQFFKDGMPDCGKCIQLEKGSTVKE